MAFDINTAKPIQKSSGGFDISTARAIKQQPVTQSAQELNVNSDANPDVPGGGQTSYAQPKDRSIGDVVGGATEAAKTMVTGATTGALGYLGGAIPDAYNQLAGNEDQKYREQFAQALTNTPESEAGQAYVKNIGDALGVLPPVLGTTPVVGINALKFSKLKSPLAKKIIENSSEATKKDFTKKLGEDRFEPRIFGMVRQARKQGFDDNMTTLMANATPLNKRRFLQQVNIMKKGKADEKYKAMNRPADVAGNSALRQIDFALSNKEKAGQQLGRVSKRLNDPIDVSAPITGFIKDLDSMGISLNEKGVPDFTGSLIEFSPSSKTLINNTLTKINRKKTQPTGLEAHEFKKFLDEDLFTGKQSEGGVSGKVERVMEKLRKGINESINEVSPAYKEANKRFSDNISVINDIQDVVGKKLDIKGKYADKAFGTALRGFLNNTKGRANILTAVENLEKNSKKYGGSFDDDILAQMLVADELDAVFGGGGRTTLRGEVKKGNVDAAIDIGQMTGVGMLATGAKKINKTLQGINEKNQIKAIEALLKAK